MEKRDNNFANGKVFQFSSTQKKEEQAGNFVIDEFNF